MIVAVSMKESIYKEKGMAWVKRRKLMAIFMKDNGSKEKSTV